MQKNIIELFLFIFSSLHLGFTAESDEIDCSNTELVTSILNEPIDLNYVGIIKTYSNVNIGNITTTKNNDFDTNYIDARLEEQPENNTKSLVIFSTPFIQNYAKEQSINRITLRIGLGCDLGRQRTLIFYQPFKEGNYFSPVFTQPSYELLVPMPLFAGFDLSTFAVIAASDDDLSNNEIQFSSNDSARYHIAVGTKAEVSADRKTYFANLTLDRIYLSLAEEIKLQIIATDNGKPPLSSNATVIIRADPLNSLPPTPRFTQIVYSAALNENLTLAVLQVVLEPSTYTADVNFSKFGPDQRLFRLERRDNVLEISLLEALNASDLSNRRILEFEIKAKNRKLTEVGQAVVLITLPNIKDSFQFSHPLYEGTIDEQGSINMPSIEMNTVNTGGPLKFELTGEEQDFFELQQNATSLQLKLIRAINLADWSKENYITLHLTAKLAEQNATTALLIKLPTPKSSVSLLQLQFEKPLYVGRLTSTGELQLEAMQLENNTYESNETKYSLEGDEQNLFEITTNNELVEFRLKHTPTAQEFERKFALLLVLSAINSGSKATTTIVIEIPSSPANALESVFEQAWQIGKLEVNRTSDEQQLSLNATKLGPNVAMNEYVFTLDGIDAQYFAVTVNASKREVNLMLLEPIPRVVMENKTQLNIVINAVEIAEDKVRSKVLIFVELPKRECPVPSPSSSSNNKPPLFASSSYIFSVRPNQLGNIGSINVRNQENARYYLNMSNDYLASRLNINPSSGELQLLSYVSPGIYNFNITAQNVQTRAEASAVVRLLVDSLIQCDEKQPQVASALLIKYIEEEKEHRDIMSITLGECEFKIVSMQPNDKVYVSIDENSKMLNTIAIDREDAIFSRMSEPQIQLKLKLSCNATSEIQQQPQSRMDNRSLMLNEDIPFTRDITMVTLFIVDINDNAPQFLHPSKPTQLGYPDPDICLELFPEYLTKVKAYDRDDGFNAKIRYSMRSNDHFAIDAVSGIIFPKAQTFQLSAEVNETTLIVTATDRDGDVDGLTTAAVLLVKRLSARHFTLLTLQTKTRDELNGLLQQLASRTKYQVESIRTAILPGNSTGKSMLSKRYRRDVSADELISQKVWIYALYANEPVESEDFKRRIALITTDLNVTLLAETYDEVGLVANSTSNAFNLSPPKAKRNDLGYIIAISIMSLVVLLLLCFLLWHFYMRAKCHQRDSPKMSKLRNESEMPEIRIKSASNFAHVEQYIESLPAPTIHNPDSATQELCSDEMKRSEVKDAVTVEKAFSAKTSEEADSQQRSQVKFNEQVEHI